MTAVDSFMVGAMPAYVAGVARVTPSPRRYNNDIAPVQRTGRHWRAYNVLTPWANDVHSLGNCTFAIGLFALGLGGWQILLTFAIGASALFILLTLSGLMGSQTGLPFPVMSWIAFGIRGGRVAAICRGGVAIVWFGIQTCLASGILSSLLTMESPRLAALAGVEPARRHSGAVQRRPRLAVPLPQRHQLAGVRGPDPHGRGALALSVAPNPAAQFSWIIGAVLAAALYLLIRTGGQEYRAVDGEAIARPSR